MDRLCVCDGVNVGEELIICVGVPLALALTACDPDAVKVCVSEAVGDDDPNCECV